MKTNPTLDHPLSLIPITESLIEEGRLEADTVKHWLKKLPAKSTHQHPLVALAEQKWPDLKHPHQILDIETLTQWLAQHSGLDYHHIDPFKIDIPAINKVMSAAFAERYKILPLQIKPSEVIIATAQPFIREWEIQLKQFLRQDIHRVVANPTDIDLYIAEFYSLAQSVKSASENNKTSPNGIANFEQLMQLGRNGPSEANDQHIARICDWLFTYAFDQRASDIHLEPRRETGHIRFRIDGLLHEVYHIPISVMTAMTSRIKIMGRMDMVEKRRPQDGRIKTVSADGREVELRLSTMPTAFGEKMVMRVFDPKKLIKSYSDLGFENHDKTLWQQMVSEPNGLILVTGPTGSGKTTTLYSTLKDLATPQINVCTLEDPIEMIEPRFNQMQVNPLVNVNFANGIRTLMRQDPDILMVGEIRDQETAEMALQAALTGHLVLSTLHTNDAPSAIARLIDLGIPAYLLQSTLLGVMAQRLIRTLCPHCKIACDPDPSDWQKLTQGWPMTLAQGQPFAPTGCLKCRMSGYLGRIGIYETLLLTPALKKLIKTEMDIESFRQSAFKEGLQPLRIAGAMKINAGISNMEEALRLCPPALKS